MNISILRSGLKSDKEKGGYRMSVFNFIKEKLQNIYSGVTHKLGVLLSRSNPDQKFLDELSEVLIAADTGVKTTGFIIDQLAQKIKIKSLEDMESVKKELEAILVAMLDVPTKSEVLKTPIVLMVGINGSGKTTFISKYANLLKQQGKRVLVVAGDTFRAAACEQLTEWGRRIGVEVFLGKDGQDPASVIFDACVYFQEGGFDHLIIDTAGRLQTKANLMRELEKMKGIVARKLSSHDVVTLLTVDAMLGQNSLRQAEVFHEATNVNGIVLTKFDGTGKGGIVFSIANAFQLPVVFVTYGEQVNDIKQFNSSEYVHELLQV